MQLLAPNLDADYVPTNTMLQKRLEPSRTQVSGRSRQSMESGRRPAYNKAVHDRDAARGDAPDPRACHPYLQNQRADLGYEDELGPFCPRD
ncbi:hypothetical protein [Actinomadura sp. NPDC049753]|uniref:hypothetical protein n=1 Tax=Actinomadura sp. NPDC049753 TaxID=3154739 RepID=UPI00342099EC